MAKKEVKDVRYVAKQKLPGGIVKDDSITYNGKTKKYILDKTGKEVLYDCSKETDFFKKEPISAYKKGELVHFIKQNHMQCIPGSIMRSLNVTPAMEFKVISNQGKSYTLEMVSNRDVKIAVAESLIETIKYWKFYNSDGALMRMIVGQNLVKEKYNKSIGNYFEEPNADDKAKTWLSKIAETIKNW